MNLVNCFAYIPLNTFSCHHMTRRRKVSLRKEGLAKCFFLALADSLFYNHIALGHISPRVLENSLVEEKHRLFTVENRIFNCNL